MLHLTDDLKAHARQYLGVTEGASDDVYRKSVGDALAKGRLTGQQFAMLTASKGQGLLKTALATAVKDAVKEHLGGDGAVTALPGLSGRKWGPRPATVFSRGNAVTVSGGDGSGVKVKSIADRFKSTKAVAKHVRTGEPVTYLGRIVEHPSELEHAKMGAFWRYKSLLAGAPIRPLEEFEVELVNETFAKDTFSGAMSNYEDDWTDEIDGMRVKALLDESGGSGGQGLVPIWWDDAIITYPLLHSELLPFVETIEVPRGSRMVTGTLGNPTLTWGTAEGSSLTLFTTTSLASEIDTTVYPVMIGVEVGLDFLSDSPVNVGQQLQTNIGQAWLKEADNIIANGSGSSRPTGLLNTSSVTTVASVNGAGGPLTVDDAMNLLFGIAKQYRAQNWVPCFIMNDTTYKFFWSISVGPTDERRVFGLDTQGYMLMGYPVKIQNDMSTGTIVFGCLKKFRLYRRKGFDMRPVTEGQTLALKNTMLIVGRGRFGGKCVDASSMCKMTSGQAS